MRPRSLLALAMLALAAIAIPDATHAQNRGFQGVYSRDGIDVWAVGDSGVAYRSLNGGANWMSLTLGQRRLRGVAVRGLVVTVVGDSGKIWRSQNSGQSWSVGVITGAPDLSAVVMVTDQVGYAVGEAGTIVKTLDGGATWGVQASGASATLNAMSFVDAGHGWAVGEEGTVVRTEDGGGTWTPVALGTARTLYGVAARGSRVWIVGAKGTAYRSENGGGSFEWVNLKLDLGPDVRAAWVQPSGRVMLAGGGGFIRWSDDGGRTWEFAVHPMQAPVTSLYATGSRVWAVSERNRGVLSSADGGATFTLPNDMVITRQWVQKLAFAGSARGKSIDVNPENPSTFLVALGNTVYRSQNEGENWTSISTIPQCNKVNSFLVSPKDSSVIIAAVSGIVPKRLVKSDDYGLSWYTTLEHDFGEYGLPLEFDHDRPDTVYFGGDADGLYRSVDAGKNWERWSTTTFRSPCNVIAVPDSGNVILIGDGITGSGQAQYFKSVNWGQSFTVVQTRPFGASEIPGMACSRLRNSAAFGTNWGSGGVQRSADYGGTWTNVHSAGAAWGADISRDDPNLVVFGQYTGGNVFFSFDGGANFLPTSVVGSNYSFYVRDRATVLAVQSNGVYKFNVSYVYYPNNAQTVAVTSPNGGELWSAGSVKNITWSSQNLVRARIEYRPAPGSPWQTVDEVDGYLGAYAWTVPHDATTQARVRVRDAFDGAPDDSSNAGFTIAMPLIAQVPAAVDFALRPIGSVSRIPVTIQNTGTGNLSVGTLDTSTPAFWTSRGKLTLAAGTSDTVGVLFEPGVAGSYADTLVITSNAYNQTQVRVPLVGSAYDTAGVTIAVTSPGGGESWQYGSVHPIGWTSTVVPRVTLEYRTGASAPWQVIASELSAGSSPYAWSVPFDTTDHGQVRVRDAYGTQHDVAGGEIRLTSPVLVPNPSSVEYLPLALVGYAVHGVVLIQNLGTAPLELTTIASDNARFWPGRTSMTVPPRESDTLGVSFMPVADGPDSATIVLVGNDPESPQSILIRGLATTDVGVGDGGSVAYRLWQNEPNPFSGTTAIRYAVPGDEAVRLEVYNLAGQRVATLARGEMGPGTHVARFGSGAATASGERLGRLPAGVYFYRFQAGAFSRTRKMLLLK